MHTDSFCESFSRDFARFFKRVYKKGNYFVNNEFDKRRRLFKEQFTRRSMMQFQVNVIMWYRRRKFYKIWYKVYSQKD